MSYTELTVSKIWRRKLYISPASLTYGDQTIKFSDIRAVYWYSQRNSINYVPLADWYYFGLSNGKTRMRVKMWAPLALGSGGCRQVFNRLLKVSDEQIEPVIANQLFRQLQKGQPVRSRNLTLSQQGITVHHKTGDNAFVPWGQYAKASYADGHLRLYLKAEPHPKAFAILPLSQANVVALPKLLDRCIHAWGETTTATLAPRPQARLKVQ